MNKIIQFSKTTILVVLTVLFSIILVMPSCAPLEETPQEDDVPVITGYATDEVVHTHSVGKDPCPQTIERNIVVRCIKDNSDESCSVDSVVITKPSPGLTANFEFGSSATLEGIDQIILLKFTCVIAESFNHTYTLVFYKDGVLVTEEDVIVKVTVIQ